MQLIGIQLALPRDLGSPEAADPMDRPWRTAFFKQPVAGPQRVERETIVGDGVADRKNHGGPDKAVLAYSFDHYAHWQAELNLPEMAAGAFGENLSIVGQSEATICVGDVYQIGDVQLEVSQPRQPCWKIGRRWRMPELPQLVLETGRTGWYLRVKQPGTIQPGDAVELLSRPYPALTVESLNDMMYQRIAVREDAIDCPALFAGWREHLRRIKERE